MSRQGKELDEDLTTIDDFIKSETNNADPLPITR